MPQYHGEVVYLYAFDIAYEMRREPIRELLGHPVEQFSLDRSKRFPRQQLFYMPQMVRLPSREDTGPYGPVRLSYTVKVFHIGAISIAVRLRVAVDRFEDLVAFHDAEFASGPLQAQVRRLAEDVRRDLGAVIVRPVTRLEEDEAYTVFCLEVGAFAAGKLDFSGPGWLSGHRQEVAALLAQETDPRRLSTQEAEESTSCNLSYYADDLIVVDWDAALVLDRPAEFEPTLHVLELANLQLAELEAYDRILDESLENAYRDLRLRKAGRRGVLRELRELRMDLARVSDELSNITKFQGDYHLSRVYRTTASRFHLADWQRTLENKLKTLDEMYEMLERDQLNRWMLILEASIVALFVLDIFLVLFDLWRKHA